MMDLRTAKRIAHVCKWIPANHCLKEVTTTEVECGRELVQAAITVISGQITARPELMDLFNNCSHWLQAYEEGIMIRSSRGIESDQQRSSEKDSF